MARKRFLEGVAAVDSGKYEAARVAFQQAYSLRPHPAILRNLGQAEFRVGRFLEAARHLSVFVRETTFGTAEEREVAQKTLAQAESKVGRLVVEVGADGAEVSVDGERLGSSPLGNDPFYIEPGPRTVRIRKDGYDAYEGVHTFEAGRTIQLKVELRPTVLPPAPSAAQPLLDQNLPPSESHEAGGGDLVRAPTTDLSAPASGSSGAASVDEPASQRGLLVALATTGGLTVLSAGVWIGFALEGASLQREADGLAARVKAQTPATCPEVGPVCSDLHDVSQRRATANQIATIGGIAAGVSAAAFVATWLLWPKSAAPGVAVSGLVPRLAWGSAGIDLVGAFE